MKGFASIILLAGVAGLLVASASLPRISLDALGDEVNTTQYWRTQLENDVDRIIREGLHAGVIAQLEPNTIKNIINARILEYVNTLPQQEETGIVFSSGISRLENVSYLSLLHQPLFPATLTELNQQSHVLILPLIGSTRYGEYTYTGGENGTRIVHVRMKTPHAETLFAIPSGYRACVTTLLPDWPCATTGTKKEETT